MCVYQGVRSFSFSENFPYVLNGQGIFEFTYPTPLQAKPDLQGPQTGSIWALKKF